MFYESLIYFSALLIFLGTLLKSRSRVLGISLFVLVALWLSFFAAMRDPQVGFDFHGYCERHIRTARQSADWVQYISTFRTVEYVYHFVIYVTAHYTGNYRFTNFVLQMLTIGSMLWALWRLQGSAVVKVVAWLFFAFIYSTSFNVIRQSLAVGIMTLAFTFWRGRHGGWVYWTLSLLGIGSHTTAFIPILFFTIAYSGANGIWLEQRRRVLFLLISFIVLMVSLMIVIKVLGSYFPVIKHYMVYLNSNGGAHWQKTQFRLANLIYSLFGLSLVFLNDRFRFFDAQQRYVFAIICIFSLVSGLAGLYTISAARMLFYVRHLYYYFIFLALSSQTSILTARLRATLTVSLIVLTMISGAKAMPDAMYRSRDLDMSYLDPIAHVS